MKTILYIVSALILGALLGWNMQREFSNSLWTTEGPKYLAEVSVMADARHQIELVHLLSNSDTNLRSDINAYVCDRSKDLGWQYKGLDQSIPKFEAELNRHQKEYSRYLEIYGITCS